MAHALRQIQQLADLGFAALGSGPVDESRPTVSGGHVEAFEDIVDLVTPRFVVEVGSWMGRSAVLWGKTMAQHGDDWALACVDTWLGSVEHRHMRGGIWGIEMLFLEDHYPSLFRTFTATIRRAGMANNVIPMPLDSSQGLEILALHDIHADVIYVDAAHDFASARADITLALTLLSQSNPASLVLCDDFTEHWPGVQEAVRECAARAGARVVYKQGQAAILTPRATGIADSLTDRGWEEDEIAALDPSTSSANVESDEVQRLTQDLRAAHERENAARQELAALTSRFSWRVTAPLRAVQGALRRSRR